MSLQKNFEQIKAFDDGVTKYLIESKENTLTESSIQKILHFIHLSNYLQLMYTYGIGLLRELLTYFESIENYQQCILIRDTVVRHNKATGEQLKLIM